VLPNPADFPPLPLSASELQPADLPADLMSAPPEQLFPHARDAQAALAGFLLRSGHWDLCHRVSQDLPTREGSYWHAIVHRMEPDFPNAGYWFRRVGEHPIFAAIHSQVAPLLSSTNTGWRAKKHWDPHLFLIWCEEASSLPDCEKRSIATQIHRLECDLLLSWCALKTNDFPANNPAIPVKALE